MATRRALPRNTVEDVLVRQAFEAATMDELRPRTDERTISPDGRRTMQVEEAIVVGSITCMDHGDGHVVYTADVYVDVVDCEYPYEQAPVRCMRRVVITTYNDSFRDSRNDEWTCSTTSVEDVALHPHFGL